MSPAPSCGPSPSAEQGPLHTCGTHTFSIAEVGKPNLERRALAAALDVDAAFGGLGSMDDLTVSHRSAAGLLGLDGFRSEAMKRSIELTVSGRTPVRRPGLLIRETSEWRGTDLRSVGGVACTSGMRTAIDLSEQLGPRDPPRAVDSAERDRLLTIESLYRSMARLGSRRGIASFAESSKVAPTEAFTRSSSGSSSTVCSSGVSLFPNRRLLCTVTA